MPKTYVDFIFSADGTSPMRVVDRVTAATGLSFLFGPHDMVIPWDRLEELQRRSEEITRAVQGLGVYLRFQTVEEDPASFLLTWPPVLHQRSEDHHV